MATDVHRRGHGRSLEGLSVVAGAAHLIPPDAGPRNNAQAALLRASYQHYVGVSSIPGDSSQGQMPFRHRADNSGPKLVQGDYTYTTSRKTLMVSSQYVGSSSLPQPGASPSATSPTTTRGPQGTIPAMATINAANINTAAWRAYGSPSARNHQRPPLAPVTPTAAVPPGQLSPSGNKLPRVGGFKPRRPQSAPGIGADGGGGGGSDLGPVIAAIASTVSVGTAPSRRGSKIAAGVDVGVLAVEQPDPIWAGRTDSGKIMFEYTLPTDPYAKYLWEEQSRKARANMSRHIAAMAAAAAVNGGNPFSHGSGGGGGGGFASTANGSGGGTSRPGSAKRPAAAAASVGGPPGLGVLAVGMRPRFSSTTLAEVARQGLDHKPPTVVGFAAPDMTEETTMPSPGDPRWAYTRLGRSQISRLQKSLKMCNAPRHHMRPASAPTLGGAGAFGGASATSGVAVGVGADSSVSAVGLGVGICTSERSLAQGELSVLDPFLDPGQGGGGAIVALGRVSELEGQRASSLTMLRTVSGGGAGGTRPGSAGLARPGSATFPRAPSSNLARAGSSGMLPRPGSASASPVRPGSASAIGGGGGSSGMVSGLNMSSGPAVPSVRGASAGRTREAAPNPRVDLRMYLAEAAADAEDVDEGTEMLPVGDLAAAGLYNAGVGGGAVLVGADGLPLPPEVLQSMPVPADQLAARLAEMVAAVAVVAAQKQIDGMEDDDGGGGIESRPQVRIEEVHEKGEGAAIAGEEPPPPPPPPQTSSPPPPPRFSRPEGDDALAALHGASTFGGRGSSRLSSTHPSAQYGSSQITSGAQYDNDGIAGWGDVHAVPPTEQPLGLGLGLGPRPGSRAGRPTSARPTSARPTTARPGSALPGRRSGSPGRGGLREGGGGLDGGMDVILEQSEGNVGEEA